MSTGADREGRGAHGRGRSAADSSWRTVGMKKRMIMMLSVMGVFLASIGFLKFRQVQAAISQASSFQPPPEAVTTIVAKEENWQPTLGAIGTVAPVKGVTVSADLPGLVGKIGFDSGDTVHE